MRNIDISDKKQYTDTSYGITSKSLTKIISHNHKKWYRRMLYCKKYTDVELLLTLSVLSVSMSLNNYWVFFLIIPSLWLPNLLKKYFLIDLKDCSQTKRLRK